MKKLTMKNIALGLALAGYAASSAFAVDATTTSTIIGTAPLIQATKSGVGEHTVDIKVYRGTTLLTVTDKVKKGDRIEVTYNVVDADGDTESAAGESAATLVPYYYKDDSWSSFTADAPAKGKATFTLTNDIIGATQIGFKIQENTQYGAPSVGKWLTVSDIGANTVPKDNGEADPADPGAGSEGPGGETGPSPSVTDPVEPSEDSKLGLFAVVAGSITTTSYNFAADGTMTNNPVATDADVLKVGGTYHAIAWEELGGQDHAPDNAADEVITNLTYTWQLTGTNTAAKGTTAAAAVDLTSTQGISADTKSITIGKNGIYTGYEAGAQGFGLKITSK